MGTGIGLRQRKKDETRRRISEVAVGMFAERGFDRVRVAEIARGAEVSEATVYNYFPTKEDLVYAGMENYEARLLETVRTRAPGTTALAAFRDFVLQPRGLLGAADPESMPQIATIARVIAESSALRTREQELFDRFVDELADLVAEERAAQLDDIESWVVANALMGVNRAMTKAVHRHARAGRAGPQIAQDVLDQGRRALQALEQGIARDER
jgi:AcrR family transcriptional regulator